MTTGRSKGRPPIGDQIKIAFPPDLLREIDEAARQDGMTRSAWVRNACAVRLTG